MSDNPRIKSRTRTNSKPLSFLKDLDIFSVSVSDSLVLYRDKTAKPKYTRMMGSLLGGCSTLLLSIFVMAMLIQEIEVMNSGANDIMKMRLGSNIPNTSDYIKNIKINDYIFKPYLEIIPYEMGGRFFSLDIFDDINPLKIDLAKLNRFVEFVVMQRTRVSG